MSDSTAKPVLVLNSSWSPINIVTVKKAIKHVWNGNALFIHPETYQTMNWDEWSELDPGKDFFIQGVFRRYKIPEIVVATKFDKFPSALVTFSRTNLFKRDQWTCQYCSCALNRHNATVDHVVPRAQKGTSTWKNCVACCTNCNARKADRTPDQAKMRLLKEPKIPRWEPVYSRHSSRVDSWSKFVR